MHLPPQILSPSTDSTDPVTSYARDVVAGTVVAGPHVRNICARHLEDLQVGHLRGFHFDAQQAQHVIDFFPAVLRLNGGQFEGIPFHLHEAQQFIVGSLFGWKRDDGTRRFRIAYIEMGKGNGKSPLVAGIGLYCMLADNEPRAEIYAAATKRDQAMILFRDAVAMVEQSPALSRRLKKSGKDDKVWNLFDDRTNSFFRPISADDGQSGPRPHVGLVDELHEHKTPTVINMMSAGRKWRRQPLIIAITNSGTNRQSVCWEYREKGIQVAAGLSDFRDDAYFPYICSLDDARSLHMGRLEEATRYTIKELCRASTTPTGTFSLLDFALRAISDNASNAFLTQEFDALTTQIERCIREICAKAATTRNDAWKTPSTKNDTPSCSLVGLPRIGTRPEPRKNDGETGQGLATEKTHDLPNTDWIALGTTSCLSSRVAVAEFVGGKKTFFELIIAMTRSEFEGCFATNATLESACWEMTRRLCDGLSTTSKKASNLRFEGNALCVDLPADDPFKDESCWPKVNPTLGTIITHEYLRGEIKAAYGMPSKEASVRRLNFCIWTEAFNPAVDYTLWKAASATYDLTKFRGKSCVMALDLSATTDLTAVVLVFLVDGLYWLWPMFWVPEEGLVKRADKEHVPYDVWKRNGHIYTTPGAAIDKDFVVAEVAKILGRYDITVDKAPYDRYRIDTLTAACNRLGVSWPLIPFGQGFQSMGPAWNSFEGLLVGKKFRHPGNPCMDYNAASAVVVEDPAGNKKLDKSKAAWRIDGMVATVMAVGTMEATAPATTEVSIKWF